MKKQLIWLVAISAFCLTAATGMAQLQPYSLIGIYEIEEHGFFRELIKITYEEGKFFIFENEGGTWTAPQEVKPVSKKDFENLLQEPVDYLFSGLANQTTALFNVPIGWRSRNFQCDTGYWMMTHIGPIELYKQ